ncbi:hypothetical protein FRC10_010848 [Ceratobasidium sp. 414]|nr:hypothetical protein FRC10_010848 [Ceratobasidium sp. 414]
MAAVVRRRQCTPNTRKAVLESLRVWKDDPNGAKVYWMNGMAGTGKATIASTLCSELEAVHQLAASFFCSRELPDCREATRIVPTIAYQLARFSLPFQSALCETLGNDPDVSARSVGMQFEKLIKEPLLRVKGAIPDGVVVAIDALDECSDSISTQSFLDVLYRFVADLPIKFFVTCRPEQSFSKKLASLNCAYRTLFHLHNIEQSVVRGDIEIYLSAELEELPIDHIRQLAERSDKLFIFAATAVRYVRPNDTSDIWYERLETMLRAEWRTGSKAYHSIDTLYSAILSSVLSRDELEPADVEAIKLVLYTVICAKKLMNIDTLAGVLNISAGIVARVVGSLRSVLHVSGDSRLVSTLHASFPDYLLNQERSGDIYCDPNKHHHLLALRCLDAMKVSLRFNICNLESSYVLDADVLDLPERINDTISSHLFYSCSHWVDHLCEAGTEEVLITPLEGFLSSGVLFWLEVLNLKKCLKLAISMLSKVCNWLQERNAPSGVCSIAQDAHKFAITFGSNIVCHSTPHIYVSVLALWSRKDPMWIYYGPRAHGLVEVDGALDAHQTSPAIAIWFTDGEVYSVAVSPDSSHVVSGYLHDVIIRDADTGNQVMSPLKGHKDIVLSVAISLDGRFIASGSSDHTVYIWDTQTGSIHAGPLKGHTGWVSSVAFSFDGTYIASGSHDWTIRIWDAQALYVLAGSLEGHTKPVLSIAFSPDGNRIVSGSADCTIRIWHARAGLILMKPLEGHAGDVCSVVFSPDGACIASGSSDRTIRIWDAQNGNMLLGPLETHADTIRSVEFSPDGKYIASGSDDCTICVRDAQTGSVVAGPLRGHDAGVRCVVFTPDSSRIISGSVSGTIRTWDVHAGILLASSLERAAPTALSVAFSPDSSRIASGYADGTICILNAHTGDVIAGPLDGHASDAIALSVFGMHETDTCCLAHFKGTPSPSHH